MRAQKEIAIFFGNTQSLSANEDPKNTCFLLLHLIQAKKHAKERHSQQRLNQKEENKKESKRSQHMPTPQTRALRSGFKMRGSMQEENLET